MFISILAEFLVFLDWDVDIFIPGHGPIATKEEVQMQIGYMREIIDLVKDHLENGTELLKSKMSAPYSEWVSQCFGWNTEFLKEYLKTV